MAPIYPPVPPVVNAPPETIHNFLASPAQVQRRMREITQQRFIADYLLRGRVQAQAGAIMYELGESLYLDDEPEAVNPGGEYPRGGESRGDWATAQTTKYGKETPIVDEHIGRYGRSEVDRKFRKTANSMIRKVDTLSLLVIAAKVTAVHGATAPWITDDSRMLRDVALAESKVVALDEGFSDLVLVLTDELYALLTSDEKILAGLAREDASSVTSTGQIRTVHGHSIVRTNKLPLGRSAGLFDVEQLGALGYEVIPSPEWSGDPANGVQSRARRDPDGNDQWLLGGRRPVVPLVLEPGAGIWIEDAA